MHQITARYVELLAEDDGIGPSADLVAEENLMEATIKFDNIELVINRIRSRLWGVKEAEVLINDVISGGL